MNQWLPVIISAITSGAGALFLKSYFIDRPKVSLRATLVGLAPVPRVLFRVVNERKDEVHISPIMGRRKKEKPFLVATEPSKGFSFRLKGLEVETLESHAHDAFPDETATDDVTGFYVEDVTKPSRRWRVPRKDLREIKKEAAEYLKRRRDNGLWGLICRSCGGTVYWRDKLPKPTSLGGYTYSTPSDEQVPELAGWEQGQFPLPNTIGHSLCPGCAAKGSSAPQWPGASAPG